MKGREFGVLSILVILVMVTSGVQGQYDEEPPSYSYDNLPQTRFTCEGRQPGRYYADQDTQCQMFHICVQMNHKTIQDFKFLCPNGTVFDQEHLVCVEYYQVVCHKSLGTNPLGQHLEIFKLSAAKPSLSLLSSSSVPIRDPEYLGQNTLGGGDDIFQVEEYNNNNKFIKSNSLAQAFPAKSSSRNHVVPSSTSTKPITTSTTTTTTTTTTRAPTTRTTTSQPLLFRSPIIPHDRDREIFPVRIDPQAQNVQQSQIQSQQRTTNHQANNNNNNNHHRGRETFASRNLATDQIHGQNTIRNQQRHQEQHQNQRSNQQQQQQQNNNQRSNPQLIRPSPQQNSKQSFQPILLSSPPEFQGIPFNFLPQPGSGNNNFRLQIQATTPRPTTGLFQSTFRTSLPLQGTQNQQSTINSQTTKIPTFQQQSSRFSDEFFVKLPSTKRPFFSIDALNDFTARGFKDQLIQSQLRSNNQNQNQSPTSATVPLGFTFSPDLKSSSTNNFISFPPTTQTPFVKPTTFNPTSFQRTNGQFKVQKMDHSSNAHFLVNTANSQQNQQNQQSSEYSRSTTEDYSGSTSSGSSGSSTRDYTSESKDIDTDETYGPTLQYYEPTKSPSSSNHVNSILNSDDEIIGFETTIPSTSTTTTTTTSEKPSKRGGRRRLKQRKFRPQQQFGQFQSQSRRRPFKESNEKFLKSNIGSNDEIFKAAESVHGHSGSKNLFLTSDEKRKDDQSITSSVERQQNFSPEFVRVSVDAVDNNGPSRDKLGVIRVQTKKPNLRAGDSFGRRIRPFVRDHSVLIEAGQHQQEELGLARKPIIVRRRRPSTTPQPAEVNSTSTVTSISSSTSSSEHSTIEPEIYSPKRNQSLAQAGPKQIDNRPQVTSTRVRTQTSFSQSTSVTSSTSSSVESKHLQVTTEEPELITASDEDIENIRKSKKEEKRVNQSVSNSTSRISSTTTGFKVSVKSKVPLLKPKSQKIKESGEIRDFDLTGPTNLPPPSQKKKTIKIIKKIIKAESSGLSDEIEFGDVTFAPTISPDSDYDYQYFNTDDELEIIDKEQAKQSKLFGNKKANGKNGKIVKIKRTVKS